MTSGPASSTHNQRWSADRALRWYADVPWLIGCNFYPSTAINQLEMWQANSFDPATMDRELGFAAAIGMNSVRVYLHDLLWLQDAQGFKERIARYLDIAQRHAISTLFVFFDDCHNPNPKLGKQPSPIPGRHNSGWVHSPGPAVVRDPSQWARLEDYVKDVLSTFRNDRRIVMWDLYNEPGNSNLKLESMPLLQQAFAWAWEVRPEQPLTVAIWAGPDPSQVGEVVEKNSSDEAFAKLNAFTLESSDLTTFHNYGELDDLSEQIKRLKQLGRPVLCTEYMCRPRGSRIKTHVPLFRAEKVGCYNWGLVAGKSQTIYPWGSPEGAPEPEVWFHDMLRADGTPFDAEEVEVIKQQAQLA